MTASLDVVVVRAPEYEQNLRTQAQQFIVNAETMINTAKGIGADTSEAESILARARNALAKGNYEQAIDLADLSNRMASEQYDRLVQKLRPIQFGLLILGIGATVVVSVIVYEVYRIYSKKKLAKSLKIVKGVSCPACGKGMAETYTGTLVIGYVCPKCKHVVVSEKKV
jgi:Zn-finger nucleic acid-binding protein